MALHSVVAPRKVRPHLGSAMPKTSKNEPPEVVCEQEFQVDTNLIIGALKSKSPSNVAEIIRNRPPVSISKGKALGTGVLSSDCFRRGET